MDATIHLVRHGEVENPKGVIYGRMPGYHLSERGRRQAETAADRLRDHNVGAVWSSPLERAQETAQAIAARHDAEITLDERLLESKSTFEGVGRTIAALFKSPRHWWLLRNPLKPSWGESFAEIRLRMLAAIDDAVEAATGREVVVVSHQTPLIVARLSLARSRMPPWIGFTPCHVGSITTLVIEDGTVVSASYFAPPV
jgi:broad specificity phosphatase PhoE